MKIVRVISVPAMQPSGMMDRETMNIKTALKNCFLDGYEDFKFGRHPCSAKFYLINCVFAENMADKDSYQLATQNILQCPRRVCYAVATAKAAVTPGLKIIWKQQTVRQL